MLNSSSASIIHRYCYVLLVFFIASSVSSKNSLRCSFITNSLLVQCAYVINSDELKTNLAEQHPTGLNIRATTFPRIGRASMDSEELGSIYDVNTDETEENENEYRFLEQRSVLFPRIGKRAFHNIAWGNSLSNPHRMLDGQGRYHIDGYGYHLYPNPSQAIKPFRGKRDIVM